VRGATPLGALVAAGVLGGSALVLRGTTGKLDLYVDVPGSGAPVAGPDAARVRTTRLREVPGPGLDWTRWSVGYSNGAYQRDVVRPELVGPTAPPEAFACGSELHVGAGLFDTKAAGRGLVDLVRAEVAGIFPYSQTFSLPLGQSVTLRLPAMRNLQLAVRFGPGEIYTLAEATLTDSTILSLGFSSRVTVRDGAPVLERMQDRHVHLVFAGPARDDVVAQAKRVGGNYGAGGGCALGMVFGPGGCVVAGGAGLLLGRHIGGKTAQDQIAVQAPAEVAAVLDKKLAELSLGLRGFSRAFALDPERPGDALRVRLDGAPTVTAEGLTLPLCTSFTVAPPLVSPGAPGPLALAGKAPADRPGGARLSVSLSPAALHQALYYAWQSGLLRRVGQSPAVLAGLSDKVKATALDFAGFDPRLPPTLSPHTPEGARVPLVVGDVALGTLGPRTVTGHALLDLAIVSDSSSIRLDAFVRDLYVGCTEPRSDGVRLTPCLSDLVPVARELARGQPVGVSFSRRDVLARLPAVAFRGLSLELTAPEARTLGSPAGLVLGAGAAFVPSPPPR
jgi:hypothetical protein